jgi:hypothetical protein
MVYFAEADYGSSKQFKSEINTNVLSSKTFAITALNMATHDIQLPFKTRPKFPARCVCCEQEHPQGVAKVSVVGATSSPSFSEMALDAAVGSSSRAGSNRRVTVQVPACPECVKSLERRHVWKTVALYAGVLVGLALCLLGVAALHSVWLGVTGLLAGIVGPVIWELRDPPAFTITPSGGSITYEFRSARYASEFAELNPPPGGEKPPQQG